MAGFTLAESAAMAIRPLSWMSVVVGDPLYRPYAAWSGVGPAKLTSWEQYRRVILKNGGDVLAAAADLKNLSRQLNSSMPVEALAWAQLDAGAFADAAQSFQLAASFEKNSDIAFRLALARIQTLRLAGEKAEANQVLQAAIGQFSDEKRWPVLEALLEKPKP